VARPIAYSYARFSTPEQERGDSERRQIDAARHYAEQQGFDLDESVVVDRGISAFAGKNVSEGALGEFIKRVERKKITRGSALFVESPDRGAGRSFWMWRPIME
jgi:DNA invertase Pin-like site-specific DNA recombinase